MKKLLLFIFVLSFVFRGYSETMSGDEILAFVRSKLPNEPLKLTGSLKVRAKNGFTKANLPVVMELDWGALTPSANYRIDKETLLITWNNQTPGYSFSNPDNAPTADILGTGITWADLSFSVLWWKGSKLVAEEKKINRECYVVDVPVPGSENTMRLWIEKNMGMLLEVKTLDKKQKELRRMKIVSIKKMDGMWVAKDLEIRDKASGSRTTLEISDLEWKNGPPQDEEEVPFEQEVEVFDPAESVNALAFDLYEKLASDYDDNLFFSPYSIATALAMTYGGARGETAEQMNESLHFGSQAVAHPAFAYLRETLEGIPSEDRIQLDIANALWPQKDYAFRPDYLALMKKYYDSEVQPQDFKSDAEGARNRINSWVEEETEAKIKDLITEDALDPLTRLVLVNAIYFKGIWASQFDESKTGQAPFTLSNGNTIEVPMMSRTGRYNLARTDTLQALELPYKGGSLSMIIVSRPDKSMDPAVIGRLEFREMEVGVKLPKFKLESSFSLEQTLTDLGMPLAFSENADFSGMDGTRNLHVDAVLHKAFVEVNEEGTEAAAATGVVAGVKSMPPQFIINRPFMFLIRENSTGVILFMGRVMDPSK